MDLATLTTMVTTVGFPIALAGFLLWYVNGFTKRIMDESKERELELRITITKFTYDMKEITKGLQAIDGGLSIAASQHERLEEQHQAIMSRAVYNTAEVKMDRDK